ncbi:hypothetical protein OE88DRAFT_1642238 [Heliocybe sulcata]|uniref:rRNA-processing protein FYV7 n=1 Tax=Heliocybe sulcata TaxID=5364 RepID=A0A5C3NDK7_9AGAM|nr:hypothetical protein OE88DRAFT_1642238 [Heliocybe sulcata]
MAPTTTEGIRKRKQPPTFQHLPADRAKKLKKRWVETQKIKSKWKAEKRKKMGPSAGPHAEPEPTTLDAAEDRERSENSETASEGSESEPEQSAVTPQPKDSLPKPRPNHRKSPESRKEHPKKSGSTLPRPQGQVKATDRRDASRRGGNFAPKGRQSRQPDMRQRMNALLDKIKRDYA